MLISNYIINSPGEYPVTLAGLTGKLEGILVVPNVINKNYIALLGHPHSLQGGTMHNKVVTTMARIFKIFGIPSLRFNFRGVGQSEGDYDHGIGESNDMVQLAQFLQQQTLGAKLIFAGFSFGGYVAYRAAALINENSLLITVAPPMQKFDFTEFNFPANHWLIAQSDDDEIVAAHHVFSFAALRSIKVLHFQHAGHFFHGKLVELKEKLVLSMISSFRLQLISSISLRKKS